MWRLKPLGFRATYPSSSDSEIKNKIYSFLEKKMDLFPSSDKNVGRHFLICLPYP